MNPARKESFERSRKDIISYMRDLDGEQKELIKKFVNFRMLHGKRTRVSPILYKTFHRPVRSEGDGINLLGQAVDQNFVAKVLEFLPLGLAHYFFPEGKRKCLCYL